MLGYTYRMPEELNFEANEFLKLPVGERIRRCRLLAKRATALAAGSTGDHRDAYAEIAKQWLRLADDMEHTDNIERNRMSQGKPGGG